MNEDPQQKVAVHERSIREAVAEVQAKSIAVEGELKDSIAVCAEALKALQPGGLGHKCPVCGRGYPPWDELLVLGLACVFVVLQVFFSVRLVWGINVASSPHPNLVWLFLISVLTPALVVIGLMKAVGEDDQS